MTVLHDKREFNDPELRAYKGKIAILSILLQLTVVFGD